MTKIIKFDPSLRQGGRAEAANPCDHKNVVAYTASRTVVCAICGTGLDPFDVVVELFTGSIPPDDNHRELKLYLRELERREGSKRK